MSAFGPAPARGWVAASPPAVAVSLALVLGACGEVGPGDGPGDAPAAIQVDAAPTTVHDDDLVQVADLRADAEGRIWVLTDYPPLVRVFDPDGTPVGAFGQPGGGPAEFGTAWALVRADEGMGVVDSRRGLLRTYAPDGTLLHERPVEDQLGFPTEMRSVYFGDLGWTWRVDGGLLQDRYPPQPTTGPMQFSQAYDFWLAELAFFPDDGAAARTVIDFGEFVDFTPGEGPRTPRPLSAGPLWDLCPGDEFVFHTGAAGEVVRVGLDGQVLSRARAHLPLDPVDVDILAQWMGAVVSQLAPMPGDTPEAMAERIRMVAEQAEPYLEPTVPPTRLRCDAMGRVWIQLFDLDDDPRGYAREWVVLDRDGAQLARVTFLPGFLPSRFGEERVLGVIRDALDVETVGWVPAPRLR